MTKKRYSDNAAKQRAYRQRMKCKRNENVTLGEGCNAPKTILSLCDYSGSWSKPYLDAGYHVIQVDLRHGQDVRLLKFPGAVHGILAAPPCTHFAIAGARHWQHKTDSEILEGLSVVDACLRLVAITAPRWWVLENPKGRLVQWLGQPTMKFQPYFYGDEHTKLTYLWGSFNKDLPLDEVEPVTGDITLKIPGRKEARQAARSITPAGFARAFFLANP